MGTGYAFCVFGLLKDARRIHGLRFADRTALLQCAQESPIAMDERSTKLRLPHGNDRFAAIVNASAQTLDSSDYMKDRFYDTLDSTHIMTTRKDKIILLGDFNAWVGRNRDIFHGVIVHHDFSNINRSCLRLLSLSALNWVFSSQAPHSSSLTCTTLLGCISGPNTGTSLTTSLSGPMISM